MHRAASFPRFLWRVWKVADLLVLLDLLPNISSKRTVLLWLRK